MVLVTDGKFSFLLLSYGNLQWGGDFPNETYEVAFSGMESNYRINEGPIQDITTLSNVGVPGLFMFRVDQVNVTEPTTNVTGKIKIYVCEHVD